MIRRPPRSTQSRSSAASDVYKRQLVTVRNHVITERPRRGSVGYEKWDRWAERPMLVLALVFLVVLVAPLVVDLPAAARTAFSAADLAIWPAFAVDYGVRLY